MKKLFLEVGILVVLVVFTYLTLTRYVDRHFFRANYYMAMSLTKEKRLTSLHGPRMVLVGGSNVLFGFDSNLLQQHRQAKVVNMGLHAGLGLPFMLNESLGHLGRQDTVILCPEYFLNNGDIDSQIELMVANPEAQRYFEHTFYDRLRVYVARFQRCVTVPFTFLGKKPTTPRTYRVDNLNEFGDIDQYYPEDKKPPETHVISGVTDELYVRRMNAFVDGVRAKGAVVYVTFPAVCATEFKLHERAVLTLEKQLRNELHCPILGSARNFVYPDHYFFDSVYHLTEDARQRRTRQVLELLEGELSASRQPIGRSLNRAYLPVGLALM